MIIDGEKIAEGILNELKKLPVPTKKLVAVLSGNDSASISFLRQKEKVARELGVDFELKQFPESLSQGEFEEAVRKISEDDSVGGIIVQLPLPTKYNRVPVLDAIDFKKDTDALRGGNKITRAPAALSLKYILEDIGFDPANKKAVVVGYGFLIGQPITNWLTSKNAQVVIIEKDYFDKDAFKGADLVVSGTGQSNLIKGEHLKHGVVVVDYGYGVVDGKVCGDTEIESVSKVASFVTPTPGGTGPVVVVALFVNFYNCFPNGV
ncbi:MAG: bifunctional 5,10-methylenetetrahydrofolate dehydrogenase/5,10-methenyltetrahydrofolate cyclohydrolase [Candidatus Yonathbacteria bacterium]|nr:bifunctional 5,10-methylenetetrahydrofolate dehydrogenase/5,10-methenyltetrahydrofolate cyclohydrolase [Candidatus Yonathbacteria bacterium]